jgi:hypothetical protein
MKAKTRMRERRIAIQKPPESMGPEKPSADSHMNISVGPGKLDATLSASVPATHTGVLLALVGNVAVLVLLEVIAPFAIACAAHVAGIGGTWTAVLISAQIVVAPVVAVAMKSHK